MTRPASAPAAVRAAARAADGCELAVTRFPAREPARGTLLVAGAMGVRQDFYAPLARHCAEGGFHVLTFDFRGVGWSRGAALRGFDADVSTWISQDFNAMLHEARRPAPGLPLALLGHSLGGQILGAAPDNAMVSAVVTVTAGSGWYRLNDRMPLRVRFLWFVAIPALTPLFGYFPGRLLRAVGDLPGGVAWQWRRWCLHPEYLLCEGGEVRAGFDRVRAPILGYSFEDDPFTTRPAVDQLHGFYRAASVERRHVRPEEVGVSGVGHFGYFSERNRDTLWRETLAWLQARA